MTLVGLAYFLVGVVFAAIANPAGPGVVRTTWRLAAWAASLALFALHVRYECVRHGGTALATALRASAAVALGALVLAVYINLRAEWANPGPHRSVRLAIVVFPIVGGLPAFVVAWAAAAALSRMLRAGASGRAVPGPSNGKE
jgi:hypothetical protein